MVYQLDDEIWFPKPELADEDGLLAVGGDLSPERLLLAYNWGIFPWYTDETPIMWYSPHRRFVLFPHKITVSKSMKQVMRKGTFTVTFDRAFAYVVSACASITRKDEAGTWITDEMKSAYLNLHQLGYAHSVEVWQGQNLVGGLYGVTVNRVFCGENMFSKVSNASKLALIWLCRTGNYKMVDCQFHTPHLESMGAGFISRNEYLGILS